MISIHALTRRATESTSLRLRTKQISIHALTRRATGKTSWMMIAFIISIHALTRRATVDKGIQNPFRVFQSTPSRGGRHLMPLSLSRCGIFQSTPSRGGRPAKSWVDKVLQAAFQSTPSRGGRRHRHRMKESGCRISIHALTRRATMRDIGREHADKISIHALTRRATRY